MSVSKSQAFVNAMKTLPRLRASYRMAKERRETLLNEYNIAKEAGHPWHEIDAIKRKGQETAINIDRLRKEILEAEDAVCAMGWEPKVRLDPDEAEAMLRGKR